MEKSERIPTHDNSSSNKSHLDILDDLKDLDPMSLGWSNMAEYFIHKSGVFIKPDDPTHNFHGKNTGVTVDGVHLPNISIADMLISFPDSGQFRFQLTRVVGNEVCEQYIHEVSEYRLNVKRLADLLRSR